MGVKEHKKGAGRVDFAVITVSDTRTKDDDTSGSTIKELIAGNDHQCSSYSIIKDDKASIQDTLRKLVGSGSVDIIVITGGTGLAGRDVTIEAARPMFEKELPAFGMLFAQQSYHEIGSAAIMSRACAGTIGRKAVFCIPGSTAACRLAMERLILPEAGHIVKHLRG